MIQDLAVHEAIRATEDEIFNYGADHTPEELSPPYERELEQVDGWNGEPLSEAEQWATTMNPNFQSHVDRPIALAQETAELERGSERERQLELENKMLREKFDPDIQAQNLARRAEQEAALVTEAIENPGRLLDNIAATYSSRTALDAGRVESSLQAAAAKYGPEFEVAYKTIVSQPQNDPLARAVVQRVWNSPDPGETLMAVASGSLTGRGESGNPPPFMPGAPRAAPRNNRNIGDDVFERAARAGSEADIWNDATREGDYWGNV